MAETQKILITGATGTQGGGAIRAILPEFSSKGKSIEIHALVRDPSSEAARALAQLSPNVKLFKGDFENLASIQAAAEGTTAVFLNVTPVWGDPQHGEIRHARNVITAAKQVASVKHFIYTSVTLAGEEEIVAKAKAKPDHFFAWYTIAKKTIEEDVEAAAKEQGWRWTILRPGMFFTNFVAPSANMMYPTLAKDPAIVDTAYSPDTKLGLLDPDDVGAFVAKILVSDDAQPYNGKIIPIASIEWTFGEIIEHLNKGLAGKKTIKANFLSESEAKVKAEAGDVFLAGQLWNNGGAGREVIEETKKWDVPLGTWEGFLEKHRDRLEKAAGL